MTKLMNKIMNAMNENPEGCSINPNTGNTVLPKTGYFVALTDNEMTQTDENEIIKLGTLAVILNLKDHFLGYWMDSKTGKRFLDLSVHIEDKTMALEIAKIHNQKAIFDCKNFDSIYC